MGTSIWFLVIMAVMPDNTAKSEIFSAPDSQYNTQQMCMAAGKELSEKITIASEGKAKVYFNCHAIEYDKILLALPRA
jgi:hypothetical protein